MQVNYFVRVIMYTMKKNITSDQQKPLDANILCNVITAVTAVNEQSVSTQLCIGLRTTSNIKPLNRAVHAHILSLYSRLILTSTMNHAV